MRYSPLMLIHICSGLIGLLSGAVAVSFRKGNEGHRVAGNVFVVSMMALSASGAYLALIKSEPGNVLGGVLTFYLVATAWRTARRAGRETGIFDWVGVVAVLGVLAVTTTFGIEAATSPTGLKYDYPPGPYFFLGSAALFATIGDVRMLVRGGVTGTKRLARHLWRMCFALFIASMSVFLARQQLFPAFLRKSGALYLLSFLPILLMIFWLIRVRFAGWYRRREIGYRHA
jgi:uncharacterized membrane protein